MLIPCEAEGSKPVVGGICFGVAETVCETGSSSIYFSKDTFDAIPISMTFISEIEAVTSTGVFQ
jgi:hypothetical protein